MVVAGGGEVASCSWRQSILSVSLGLGIREVDWQSAKTVRLVETVVVSLMLVGFVLVDVAVKLLCVGWWMPFSKFTFAFSALRLVSVVYGVSFLDSDKWEEKWVMEGKLDSSNCGGEDSNCGTGVIGGDGKWLLDWNCDDVILDWEARSLSSQKADVVSNVFIKFLRWNMTGTHDGEKAHGCECG